MSRDLIYCVIREFYVDKMTDKGFGLSDCYKQIKIIVNGIPNACASCKYDVGTRNLDAVSFGEVGRQKLILERRQIYQRSFGAA